MIVLCDEESFSMVCVNSFLVNELGLGQFLDCLKTLSLVLRWLLTRDESLRSRMSS